MIRTIARPLLASAFVLDGVQMLKNTDDYKAEAKVVADNARRLLPPNVTSFIPNDDTTNVRVLAGTKIVGAALLGSSKAPRVGAGLLTALQLPTTFTRNAFWSAQGKEDKKAKQLGLISDLALLGGLAITTADTAGKPGLTWRVQKAMPGKSEQEKMLASAQDQAQDLFTKAKESAVAGKDAVAQYVDDHSDEWKETATQLRDQTQTFAATQADNLTTQAAEAQKFAQAKSKEAQKQAKRAHKQAKKQAKKYR